MHGARVLVVERPGEHAGAEADALVTAIAGCALLVRSADCAPVALLSAEAVGIVHAGWRGLEAGVIEAAVDALRDLGAVRLSAQLGPCIGPECYPFRDPELGRLVTRFGPAVRGAARGGEGALDLRRTVDQVLTRSGVERVVSTVPCTACEPERYFSFRARGDSGRQGSFAWLEP